jgi:alpha-tubulin suppressor-like RCC1 family protein
LQLTDVGPWARVEAGAAHTCALHSGGYLWCWGRNGEGQTSDPTTSVSFAPVPVMFEHTFTKLAAGALHNCAIKAADRTLWCWGSPAFGQLGFDAGVTAVPEPVQVGLEQDFVDVVAGEAHTCARREQGQVWCFGRNSVLQLGDAVPARRRSTPVVLPGVWLGLGETFGSMGCAQSQDGWSCWGLSDDGALGDGTLAPAVPVPVPLPM